MIQANLIQAELTLLNSAKTVQEANVHENKGGKSSKQHLMIKQQKGNKYAKVLTALTSF